MLGGGSVQRIVEMRGQGHSIRSIAAELGLSRNTVRRYLRDPGIPRYGPRPARASKLDRFKTHLEGRLAEGVGNGVVLLRELRALGYTGGYTVLKDFLRPRRPPRQPSATVRFETPPGQQAQIDWGKFRFTKLDGSASWLWCFVMVLSWCRAIYVEFCQRADSTSFLRCHLRAFEHFGGVPAQCLYDNTKLVVLGRQSDEPRWNERFLDFSLRVGFETKLCQLYRAQTKGRVESGIKYVEGNLWPTLRFVDLADLNRQALTWCTSVADVRLHGTTFERPVDRLERERPQLRSLPPSERLTPFLRDVRRVARDGFVQVHGCRYGVPWSHAGRHVSIGTTDSVVEIWDGSERLAVHPRSFERGHRFIAPRQWEGLRTRTDRPVASAVARQVPVIEVEQRALAHYDLVVEETRR
jgi:transposase